MEEKGQKKPAPKPRPRAAKHPGQNAKRLRKGIFRLSFKKGAEPLPAEITGPIVGMFPRTQHSYEIVWLDEEQATEVPPADA